MTLGLKSHDQYGAANEINDDGEINDGDTFHAMPYT